MDTDHIYTKHNRDIPDGYILNPKHMVNVLDVFSKLSQTCNISFSSGGSETPSGCISKPEMRLSINSGSMIMIVSLDHTQFRLINSTIQEWNGVIQNIEKFVKTCLFSENPLGFSLSKSRVFVLLNI